MLISPSLLLAGLSADDYLVMSSRNLASFWRFGLVGIGGLFVDMTVLYVAIWGMGMSPLLAKMLSFLVAVTFTWWMNRLYTFGVSGKSLLHEWATFLTTNAFGGAVNLAVYTLMVMRFLPYFWMPALATAVGSLSGLLFNYMSSLHIVFKPKTAETNIRNNESLPKLVYPLSLLVCLVFGGIALWQGMDANWDLRNYHWYNGWAFVNSLVGRDLLIGQLASFYNPILDVPYALAAEHLPARFIGFVLGMIHGLNFLVLFVIAWRLFNLSNPRHRFTLSFTTALTGVLGAGGWSEIGTVFYDNVLSLGVLISVLLVLVKWDQLAKGRWISVVIWGMTAGLPVGLTFGLKQPMVIYCIGLCGAFLFVKFPWMRRIWVAFWFGIGVLAGFAISGGYWAWHLWQVYGNPLFPYFNHLFKSPWALPIPYRDEGFTHGSLNEKLLLIYRFSFDTKLVGEIDFRDFRILALAILLPLAIAAWVWIKPTKALTRLAPTSFLLSASILVCVIWVPLFSIYRYLVPLEMLAPLLIAASIGLLPFGENVLRYMAFGLLVVLVATTKPSNWIRVPWEGQAIKIDGIGDITKPEQTLVLLSGREPLSFLIPAFPKTMRFYRIDGTFTLTNDSTNGFRKIFREAISNNPGAVISLHIVTEEHNAVIKLAQFGLALDKANCRKLTSPIGANTYAYCLTQNLNR